MATILDGILKSTQELDGTRYFDGESVILLAAAVSDYGRDYMVLAPLGTDGEIEAVKLGLAIEAIYSGTMVPGAELEDRLKKLKAIPDFAAKVIEGFGRFGYRDPRVLDGNEVIFDLNGEHKDLSQEYIGRFAGAHYSTIKRVYQKLVTKDEFLGELKGRLKGLELRYFSTKIVEPGNNGFYDAGFYLHYFYDLDGHLVVWKTGHPPRFERDGRYTVIGGFIKAHDSYGDQPKKTVLSRAAFFDHQTGDRYQEKDLTDTEE